MDPTLIVLCIVAVIVGIPLGKKLFAKGEKIADKKKAALSLAVAMRAAGMELLPGILEDFAVGDVASLLARIRDVSKVVEQGNDAIMLDLEKTFERVLAKKLASPAGLALIKAKIVEAETKK